MVDIRFKLDGEPSPYAPQCSVCKHLVDNFSRTCTVFVTGIPLEIWEGKVDHSKPFDGDGGILFDRAAKGARRP